MLWIFCLEQTSGETEVLCRPLSIFFEHLTVLGGWWWKCTLLQKILNYYIGIYECSQHDAKYLVFNQNSWFSWIRILLIPVTMLGRTCWYPIIPVICASYWQPIDQLYSNSWYALRYPYCFQPTCILYWTTLLVIQVLWGGFFLKILFIFFFFIKLGSIVYTGFETGVVHVLSILTFPVTKSPPKWCQKSVIRTGRWGKRD